MKDKQESSIEVEGIRESLESDQAADALHDYVSAIGMAALEKSQEYDAPQYQLTPRMRKRLLRIQARELRGPRGKVRLKLALIAALLAVLLIVTQASAIRSWIGNYFLSEREESVDLSERVRPENSYSYEVSTPTAIPEGFTALPVQSGAVAFINYYGTVFRNSVGEEITFSVYADSTSLRLDGEEAEIYEQAEIGGHAGTVIIKNGRVNLVWGKYPPFQLRGPARLKAELLQMAESVNLPEEPGLKHRR